MTFGSQFTKYNQQDVTILNLFISVDALHVSDGFSIHHHELKTAHIPDAVCAVLSPG